MNNYRSYAKIWFMVLLLVAFVAGCGSNNNNTPPTSTPTNSKAMTAFSLNGAPGTIDIATETITVTMPYGTNLATTPLVATFTTTGAGVEVGNEPQESGTDDNLFSSTEPLEYTVIAEDGTKATYSVDVDVALNPAKAITAFSLNGATGSIDKAARTITVTLPFGTDLTGLTVPLVATFTTTGASVTVGGNAQTSGTTQNNFSADVEYTVIAGDGSTTTYIVTVTVAPADAKAIIAYSLNGVSGTIGPVDVGEGTASIAVIMPFGTDVTSLIATFITTGGEVTVDSDLQISGVTVNDFTLPVIYTVTDSNGGYIEYTVTVTLAASSAQGPAAVDLGTAGDFVILAKAGISTTGTTAVVGDMGVSPIAATAITGFGLIADPSNTFSTSSLVTGSVYAADYAAPTPTKMTTAVSDMEIAFTDAAGRTNPGYTELGAGNISGMILVPGLYKWGTGVLITNAGVTLSGGADDVWIFQIAQNLTVNNGAIVTLSGGAQAKNIFWQVSGQATLGTTTDFKGIILSQTLISFNTGAVMEGRALAQTAVTLNATDITEPDL